MLSRGSGSSVCADICVGIPGWGTQVQLRATEFKGVSSPLEPMDPQLTPVHLSFKT